MNGSVSMITAAAAALALTSVGCNARVTTNELRAPRLVAPSSDLAADLCAGLSEVDQERPSFLRADGIEAIRPVTAGRATVKFGAPELLGVEITLRPGATVTKPWVARVLRCHMADPVALALSEGFEDPLAVGVPVVSLDQTDDRVVLRIAGRNGAQGEEILRRAEHLHRSE